MTPVVDGSSLSALVSKYEQEQNFAPAGGYGGIVPAYFNYGALDRYFLGNPENDDYYNSLGGIYLLGCQCGEVGCWPLIGRVRATEQSVLWDSFRQPHRPQRDYSTFAPFEFDLQQYREALVLLVSNLSHPR